MDLTEVKITAIIPVYNGRKYIKSAVNSVISQTLMPVELIIVDDGSTDQSLDEISDISTSFPVKIITQKNSGQSSARNNAASKAVGDYLAFLDQDDEWYPRHLEKLMYPFLLNPELGWSYSDLDEIDENGLIISKQMIKHSGVGMEHPKMQLISLLSADMFILPSASLISKHAFLEVGGFDEQLSGYEDDDLFLRMFRMGYNNVFLNESLSKWRIYGASTSYSPRMSESRKIYANKLIKLFPDDPQMGRFWVRDCIAPRFYNTLLSLYIRSLNANEYESCLKTYQDMIKYKKYFKIGKKMKAKLFFMKYPKTYKFIRDNTKFIKSLKR